MMENRKTGDGDGDGDGDASVATRTDNEKKSKRQEGRKVKGEGDEVRACGINDQSPYAFTRLPFQKEAHRGPLSDRVAYVPWIPTVPSALLPAKP